MSTSKMITLLQTLNQRTSEGIATWTTGSRDDTFLWSGSSGSVALLTHDNDGQSPWIVRIMDADGRIVEEEVIRGDSDFYELLEVLYSNARASALNIDKTIDGLLDDLSPF